MQLDQVIVSDHQEIHRLYDAYRHSANQPQAAANVIRALTIHSAVEDAILYPVIEKSLPNGKQDAEKSRRDHKEVQGELERINVRSKDSYQQLEQVLRHFFQHSQQEEVELLPNLMKAISPSESTDLASRYQQRRAAYESVDQSIIREHVQIRHLLNVAGQDKSKFSELVHAVEAHIVHEEAILYPEIEAVVPDGRSIVQQHRQEDNATRQQINELSRTVNDPSFAGSFANFASQFSRHMDEEESSVLPALTKLINPSRSSELGRRIGSLQLNPSRRSISDVITNQHIQLKGQFDDFTRSSPDRRKIIGETILRKLEIHAATELAVLGPIASRLPNGQSIVNDLNREVEEVKNVVTLVNQQSSNPTLYSLQVELVIAKYTQHFHDEEVNVLSQLDQLNDKEKSDLATSFTNESRKLGF